MAEWRALGYVPDSDEEEDDTQTPDLSEQLALPHDVDGLKEDNLDENYDPSQALRVGKEEAEDGEAVKQNGPDDGANLPSPGILGHSIIISGPERPELPQLRWDNDDIDGIHELRQHYGEGLTAVPLEAELFPAFEDEDIAHPTTPTYTRPHIPWDPLPSSPLTEFISTPLVVNRTSHLEEDIRSSHTESHVGPRSIPFSALPKSSDMQDYSVNMDTRSITLGNERNKAIRNLRHRNPIQLHPYAIENERYRQTLKDRGVIPLRIAPLQDSLESQMNQESQRAESDPDEESQPQNIDLSSHLCDSSSPSFHNALTPSLPRASNSSHVEEEFPEVAVIIRARQQTSTQPHRQTVERERHRPIVKARGPKTLHPAQTQEGLEENIEDDSQSDQPEVDEDRPVSSPRSVNSSQLNEINSSHGEEDFPEVSALLRNHCRVAVGASKRRKLTHTFSKKTRRFSQQRRMLEDPETPPMSADSVFDLRSSSQRGTSITRPTSPLTARRFRVPIGVSPVKLPMPVTYSEPRIQSITKQSRIQSQSIILSDSSNDDNEDLSDSSSSGSSGNEGEKVQHKIRLHGNVPVSNPVKWPKAKSYRSKKRKVQTSLDRVVQPEPMKKCHTRDRSKKYAHNKENHRPSKKNSNFTSLRDTDDSRPALLESLQEDDDRIRPRAAFQRHVLKAIREPNVPGGSNILLDRFLGGYNESIEAALPDPDSNRFVEAPYTSKPKPQNLNPKQPQRKTVRPQTILGSSGFRHSSSQKNAAKNHQNPPTRQDGQILHGLGPFGTQYTQNFDISPLQTGTYLHSSTFVGSGGFHRSLQLDKHERLDRPRGFSIFNLAQELFKWGPWNDLVSTQLGKVFNSVSEHLQPPSVLGYQATSLLLIEVVHYFSDHLSYFDPIDRVSCLQRCKSLIMDFLVANGSQRLPSDANHPDLRLRILNILLVFSNQLRKISTHHFVPEAVKAEIRSQVLDISQQALHLALNVRFDRLCACLQNVEAGEFGIRDSPHSIEAVIIAHHVLRESWESVSMFWEIVWNVIISQSSPDIIEFRVLERSWRRVFTILPFLAIDAEGLMQSDQRFKASNDGWPAVRQLISCVLELHDANPLGQAATFNAYCRAIFGRCLHLVNAWGWIRCESIVATMFAFFAGNNFAHLNNEESHGSPRYLEHLDQKPDLKPSSEDRCFHIFLKVVGSGLTHMQRLYPEKKVRDIVWRLMPNHGRLHLKDEQLSQRDIDALRNHHDLLCTLYWASPPLVRPRLSAIRNLVHLDSAHREAYRIHIRAWSNLVRFQLSTDEDITALKPFADWHDDFLAQLLRQHDLAGTEADDHLRSMNLNGGPISNEVLEPTIAKNERQVAVVLSDALASLNFVINTIKDPEKATVLLTPVLVSVFNLFNTRKSHVTKAIMHALDIMYTYTSQIMVRLDQSTARVSNDDSQDYGDWSAFEDDMVCKGDDLSLEPPNSAAHLLNSFHEPVKQLLSNCFGADTAPEDALLLKIIQVWGSVAHILVRKGIKSWNDYLSPFGIDSWSSLRRTEQTQKFTTYYLAVLLEKERGIFHEQKSFFLTSWIDCLVERESMIKFQHVFTTAILNVGSADPMLKNLPFSIDPETGIFDITASDFLGRRLPLISSLLSNMRETMENAQCDRFADLSILRQEYLALVKHLMNAMKRNYQDLGHASTVKGAYVEFVHRIVEFLQQHTSDICPVDRFFIDSAGFPLPATDPTYIVGRLRNYGLRLQDPRTPKQLAVFLQSVSERAAVDGQQNYLVGQLYAAMSDVVERGDVGKPTLQSFLIRGIVPAYIEVAFSASSGWLLVSPILQAVRDVFRQLLKTLDGASVRSINAITSIMTAFFESTRNSMQLLTDHSGLLEQAYILRLLGLIYSSITALLPTIDYIVRLSSEKGQPHMVEYIEFFKSFAIFSSELLLQYDDVTSPDKMENETNGGGSVDADIRDFALKELRDSLSRNWVCHDGHYYVIRGKTRRDVAVEGFSYLEEKEGLIREFENFFGCWQVMPSMGSRGKRMGVSAARVKRNNGVMRDLLF